MGLDIQRRKRRCYLAAFGSLVGLAAFGSLVGLAAVAAAGVIAIGAAVDGVGRLAPDPVTVQQSTRLVADRSDGDDDKADKKMADEDGDAREAHSRSTNS